MFLWQGGQKTWKNLEFDNLGKKKTWNLGNFAENFEKLGNFERKNLNTRKKLEFDNLGKKKTWNLRNFEKNLEF